MTDSVFQILHEPVSTLLSKHGIQYRVKNDGAVTWYNMRKCPSCGHEGYQCGVAESTGTDGKLYHGVKCWHVADNGHGTDTPEYEDFLVQIGALNADEAGRVKGQAQARPNYPMCINGRGGMKPCPLHGQDDVLPGELLRPINTEFLAVLKKRLRENMPALTYLTTRGLTAETIEHFDLGLSTPYKNKAGHVQENALVYPMRTGDGHLYGKYGYYNIPGITQHPTDKNGWMSGRPRAYYGNKFDGEQSIFICEGAKDVWRHWQALQGTKLATELLLVTSTHGSAFPARWKEPDFWSRWKSIYLAHDNDEAGEFIAAKLASYVPREVRRVVVPKWYGKDWTDFWQAGGNVEEFEGLLEDALTISQPVRAEEEADLGGPGRYAYAPIDINGAYHNGHLYCTAQTLRREVELAKDDFGEEVVAVFEELETVVIRSDRSVYTAVWSKSHKNTKQQNQVLRLSDGTLIDKEPQANKYSTWSWNSINAYLQGNSKPRLLGDILKDIEEYLRASVWLPYEEDYALLSLTVPVTYAQSIFDSVPLIFLNGPTGSGKSQMGRAMARVSANAYVCGQSSAASIARFIDESRGFIVLDDLEAIGNRGGEFSELVQALKQSYNKATAVKLWTDVKTMRTEKLNFFGVKMINNTQGADQILGSRMLRIQTKKIPDHLKQEFQTLHPTADLKLEELRNELHTWAFENVNEVAGTYRSLYPKSSDRADEIAAPLQVMAELAGDSLLKARLEVALTRQKHRGSEPEDPIQVMVEALRNLVVQGYEMISITHLVLEMRSLIHENYGKGFTTEIPEWARPDWVGKMLRTHDLIEVEPEKQERRRLFGAHLRFYPIRRTYLDEVRDSFADEGIPVPTKVTEPTAFCNGCEGCIYSLHNCEIMPKRLRVEGKDPLQKARINY
jgi:hypothetical protein